MLRKLSFLLVVMGVLVWTNPLQADDWRNWSDISVSGKINADWGWKVAAEARFSDNVSDYNYTHFDMIVSYKVLPWLGISPSYRHIITESGTDWNTEKRPQLDINLSRKVGEMQWSDRNRFEFRFRDSGESVRYRNKLTVKIPRLQLWQLQPYLADEIFYDLEAEVLNKNRIYAGVNIPVLANLQVEVGYVRESSKILDDWNGVNVLWTALKYSY
ncbi:MAG: DUF2490 domain-containing protein [Candidatus Marinimicrobia bacterium]|nr:DUF2490 domain-containing protein [Candidatus Neomarinimicrobiota bacterium]